MRYIIIAIFSTIISYVLMGGALFILFFGPDEFYRVLALLLFVVGVALGGLVWKRYPQCRVLMAILTVIFIFATKMTLDYSFSHFPI